MNKLLVDKWTILVLKYKSIVKGQGKESHTEASAVKPSSQQERKMGAKIEK